MKRILELIFLWTERLSRPAAKLAVAGAAIAVLLASSLVQSWLERQSRALGPVLQQTASDQERLSETAGEYRSFSELRSHDVLQLKEGLTRQTRSHKAEFEMTLKMQEEQRLLEKQWEVMSTYLMLDEQVKRIHLMRGEQSLESYPVADAPPKAFGGEASTPPNLVRITSKERFAHPERGAYAEVGGQLVWNPPQVGTSVRANALGEFVTFTSGALILHGPPQKPEEHAAFPHYCLELSLPVAHKLYANTFIGTKIVLKPATAKPGMKPSSDAILKSTPTAPRRP